MIARATLLVIQFVTYVVVSMQLAPLWTYAKYGYADPEWLAVAGSLALLAFVAAPLLPSVTKRPSDIALWVLASFVLVPVLSFACVSPSYGGAIKMEAVAAVTAGFLVVAIGSRGSRRPLDDRPDVVDRDLFVKLLFAASAFATVVVILGYGFTHFDFSLDTVYERRIELRTVSAPFPGADYLVSWLSAPLMPFLIAVGLQWRRPLLVVLGFLAGAVLMSIGGVKSTVFLSVLMLAVVWCARRAAAGDRRPWFPIVVTSILAAPVLLKAVQPGSEWAYLVTRRLGLGTAMVTMEYVEYADRAGNTYFTHNLLKWLIPVSERLDLGKTVGQQITPGVGTNANANLWADGYVAWGLMGVALLSLLLVAILRFSDRLALSRDVVVATAALGGTFYSLASGYLITLLITGGIIPALILVWLMPRTRQTRLDGPDDLAAVTEGDLPMASTSSGGS